MTKIETRSPSTTEDHLQPLREVGSVEKSQFWDREDIMDALREANLRGINPESLYAKDSNRFGRAILPKRAS